MHKAPARRYGKEQWNDTRNLRQKVNKRTEKEWDKADAAFDNRDKCEQSANINAYWEPILCAAWTVELAALLPPNLLLI